jgi:hypothetical protein
MMFTILEIFFISSGLSDIDNNIVHILHINRTV